MLRIVSGRVGGRLIESPPGQDLRPMMEKVRAALFDMLWHFDAIQGHVLDLYAGSGAVGIEALSRGAEFADFVEWNAVSARTIRSNLETLGLADQGRVHRRRAEEVIAQPSLLGYAGPYDLISVTPPYAGVDYPALARSIASSALVGPGSVVVFEYPKGSVVMEEEIGSLVQLRDRRYGRTMIAIYEYPYEPETFEEASDEEEWDDEMAENDEAWGEDEP